MAVGVGVGVTVGVGVGVGATVGVTGLEATGAGDATGGAAVATLPETRITAS